MAFRGPSLSAALLLKEDSVCGSTCSRCNNYRAQFLQPFTASRHTVQRACSNIVLRKIQIYLLDAFKHARELPPCSWHRELAALADGLWRLTALQAALWISAVMLH